MYRDKITAGSFKLFTICAFFFQKIKILDEENDGPDSAMLSKDDGEHFLKTWKPSLTVVTLALEEMHTSFASGWEICIQELGKAYQRNEIENEMMFRKLLYHWVHKTIQWNTMFVANDVHYPFTILACLPCLFASCSLRRVETESHFLRGAVRIASMILCTARCLWVISSSDSRHSGSINANFCI